MSSTAEGSNGSGDHLPSALGRSRPPLGAIQMRQPPSFNRRCGWGESVGGCGKCGAASAARGDPDEAAALVQLPLRMGGGGEGGSVRFGSPRWSLTAAVRGGSCAIVTSALNAPPHSTCMAICMATHPCMHPVREHAGRPVQTHGNLHGYPPLHGHPHPHGHLHGYPHLHGDKRLAVGLHLCGLELRHVVEVLLGVYAEEVAAH